MEPRKRTIKALADELQDVFDEVKSGSMPPATGESLANIAGKIINAAKVRFEARKYKDTLPAMEEMED